MEKIPVEINRSPAEDKKEEESRLTFDDLNPGDAFAFTDGKALKCFRERPLTYKSDVRVKRDCHSYWKAGLGGGSLTYLTQTSYATNSPVIRIRCRLVADGFVVD